MGKHKSTVVFVGIDPGINGAVAALYDDGRCEVHSVPFVIVNDKKNFDAAGMARLIRSFGKNVMICIEAVHAMPGNGAVSMFFFGRGLGVWEGVVGALGHSMHPIPPQAWKKGFAQLAPQKGDKRPRSVIKAEAKKAALVLAREIFPSMAESLKRSKDDGRAEALLMTLFYARQNGRWV